MWTLFIRSPLTSFLTQLCLSLTSGLFYIRTRQYMIMGWFVQTAIFVIFNKVCTSQVMCNQFMSLLRGLTGLDDGVPILVFSLVYVIFTAHHPSTVVVMALIGQVSDVLDGDTSIVAQPGVQSRISGGTHFLPLVDLRCHLCRRTQLGTRGYCKQLPGLLGGRECSIDRHYHCLMASMIRPIFMPTHLTLRCGVTESALCISG